MCVFSIHEFFFFLVAAAQLIICFSVRRVWNSFWVHNIKRNAEEFERCAYDGFEPYRRVSIYARSLADETIHHTNKKEKHNKWREGEWAKKQQLG